MIAPAGALASIPDELTSVEAGPLMCAGITTFNALRHSGALPGDIVAILGVGGLGHLGVQFAAKMGFKTVAIARGQDKGPLAKQLGAQHYIDSLSQDPAAELSKLGGAKAILATAISSKAMSAVAGGLAVGGKLLIIGATMEPLDVSPISLIMRAYLAQPPYNLFERAIESELMPFCQKNKVALMTYGALCRGLLSGRVTAGRQYQGDDLRKIDPKFKPPRLDQYLAAVKLLDEFAWERFDRRVLHLAVRWVLDHDADIAIWGGRKPEQLDPLSEITGPQGEVDGGREHDFGPRSLLRDLSNGDEPCPLIGRG